MTESNNFACEISIIDMVHFHIYTIGVLFYIKTILIGIHVNKFIHLGIKL